MATICKVLHCLSH